MEIKNQIPTLHGNEFRVVFNPKTSKWEINEQLNESTPSITEIPGLQNVSQPTSLPVQTEESRQQPINFSTMNLPTMETNVFSSTQRNSNQPA